MNFLSNLLTRWNYVVQLPEGLWVGCSPLPNLLLPQFPEQNGLDKHNEDASSHGDTGEKGSVAPFVSGIPHMAWGKSRFALVLDVV